LAYSFDKKINRKLIAPCGMNCALCSGYLAYKNDLKAKGINHSYCRGCRPQNRNCSVVKKRCDLVYNGEIKYCFECNNFPCKSINQLDVRYRKFYRMSEIENLNFVKKFGIRKFLHQQEDKWECNNCGELICCHNGICYNCESDKLKTKRKRYRWEE
jgi:hypothetical protein